MQRYTGYFFVPLLVWMPRMARAQAPAYEPQSSTSLSSPFIYLLVIGVVGFIVFFIDRSFSTRDKETPHRRPEAPPGDRQRRLKSNRAGQVVLQLKSAFKDGTTHIVMSPLEFMQRLAALVPRPRLTSNPLPWRARAERKAASRNRPQSARASNRARMRSRAGRAGAPDLGQAAQTGLRHRHRPLPELRRQLEHSTLA